MRQPLGRSYRRLWAAATISNLGDGITVAAGPLLAAHLTDDPRLVAGLAVAQRLPWLFFALVAGALVDRWNRQRVMARANLFRALALALMAGLAATDTLGLPVLYAVFLAVGVAETFFDNAAQAFLPRLVSSPQLATANSRLYAGELAANQFAGPPIGGVLFGVAIALPFAIDSATFAVATVLIATIAAAPGPSTATTPATDSRPSLLRDIGEGLRYLFHHRLLRPMAIVLGLMNLLSAMTLATFVLLARDRLGLSDAGYGLLLTSGALGGLLATPFAPRLIRRVGEGGVMVATLWLMAAIPLLVPLTHSPWVVAGYFALEAAAGITWNVATVSLRQRIIPDRLFGRVNSVYRLLAWGTMPIGAAIGGYLADRYGLVAPYWVAVAVMAVAAAWFSPRLGNRHVEAAKAGARDP